MLPVTCCWKLAAVHGVYGNESIALHCSLAEDSGDVRNWLRQASSTAVSQHRQRADAWLLVPSAPRPQHPLQQRHSSVTNLKRFSV